jgi:hypothetical protein
MKPEQPKPYYVCHKCESYIPRLNKRVSKKWRAAHKGCRVDEKIEIPIYFGSSRLKVIWAKIPCMKAVAEPPEGYQCEVSAMEVLGAWGGLVP